MTNQTQTKEKFFDKSTWYLIIAAAVMFAAGLIVTWVPFTKGIEIIIFPGIPFAVLGVLIHLILKSKNKTQ